MNFNTEYSLSLGDNLHNFYSLLKEEDFDFKTKNIQITISKSDDLLFIKIECNSIIDLKIGTTAVQKSLDIIDKTLAF